MKTKKESELTKHILYVIFAVIYIGIMVWCEYGAINPLLLLFILLPVFISLPLTTVLVQDKRQKSNKK